MSLRSPTTGRAQPGQCGFSGCGGAEVPAAADSVAASPTAAFFAAYDAGPVKIQSLRREAQAKNLDPNLWFNNVERVAAARVGQEPVQYVRNIYKYYVAYKMIEEADTAKKAAITAGTTEPPAAGTSALPQPAKPH